MKKIKKAIIPAAGLGTRFLPATKAMPKEMLPIVDRPAIEYIVEEAIASGIEDIIIVTGKGKRAIEDHFDRNIELEQHLLYQEKYEMLQKIHQSSKVEIHTIRQKEPKGLGHAIWCARNFIGDEPFAVLLGDDIIQAETPCLKQLMDEYEATGCPVLAVKKVADEKLQNYGVIEYHHQYDKRYAIESVVEKPRPHTAPSNLAIVGRYILTPSIFAELEKADFNSKEEIQLTDAIQACCLKQNFIGYEFDGDRYDIGEKLGFIEATLQFALQNEELRDDVLLLLDHMTKYGVKL